MSCSSYGTGGGTAVDRDRARSLKESRERERLDREKERLAKLERAQRAVIEKVTYGSSATSSSSSGGALSSTLSSNSKQQQHSTTSSHPQASDSDQDSDIDAEEAAANKKEYINRVVQQWKDKSKKSHHGNKTGGGSGGSGAPSVIRFKTNFRNTILDVFRERGWKETESEYDWDIHWTNKEWIRLIYDKIHLEQAQRVNHFRNFYELTRKDLLVKNLKRAKRLLVKKGREGEGGDGISGSSTSSAAASAADGYDFFPDTYCLPAEYSLFVEAFKKTPGISWIMKPIGSSQGKGIFLFERLSQISEWKSGYNLSRGGGGNPAANPSNNPSSGGSHVSVAAGATGEDDTKAEKYIVQRYLSDPLLIGGKKFDLRIYVLVTNYNPLTCYMYRDGFARFSSTRFTMVKGDLSNAYVHLTNVAIQKKGDDYDAESGGKWDVRSLKLYLMDKYGREAVNTLFVNIQLLCIRSLLSVQRVIINDKQSFELYGYDVLIDAQLKPWLIEVNASPSLTANTPKDYLLKLALLHDTMTVIDMEKRLLGNEEQIGGFDLIYRGGFVKFNTNCTFTATLGFHNNRQKQLKRMWKNIRRKKMEQAAGTTQEQGQTNAPAGGAGAAGTNSATNTNTSANASDSRTTADATQK